MTAKTSEDQSVLDRPEHRTLRLKKILVPIDFSPPSKNAFKYAVRFAEEFGGELTLLYVLEPAFMTGYVAIPEATVLRRRHRRGRETPAVAHCLSSQ